MERSVRRKFRGVESVRSERPDWILAESNRSSIDYVVDYPPSLYPFFVHILFFISRYFDYFCSIILCCYIPSFTALFGLSSFDSLGFCSCFVLNLHFVLSHSLVVLRERERKDRIDHNRQDVTTAMQDKTKVLWRREKNP